MAKRRKILDAGWHLLLRDGERVMTHCCLLKEWDERGRVVRVVLEIPRTRGIERASITLREYHRQVRKYDLRPKRQTLSDAERKERRLKSAERYREKLRKEWKGKADFTYRLPDEVKERIYSLIATDMPNVEISRVVGVSPSQVSRMRRGQRCGEDRTTPPPKAVTPNPPKAKRRGMRHRSNTPVGVQA